ncbi:hypothetical protein R1sor_009868 [Riccia sorocarpa]|uniref:Vacuolar protein 8 n=1 Tax=Riccia sorocarpa TaxID=122646 RepID=A0ABD3HWB2_9MARC
MSQRSGTSIARRVRNSRYVHFEVVEAEVRRALENPLSHPFVLLHGDGGLGKTMVARSIAVYYSEKARAWYEGTGSEQPLVFEQVVFIECGPEADPGACLFLALRELGVEGQACHEEEYKSYGRGGDALIRAQLAGLLKEHSILIILDDVSDARILQTFLDLFGARVKGLVTTQDEGLWLDSSMIEMAINREVAAKVLASHGGFPGQVIPSVLKELADRLIEETEALPLAAAALANAISRKRASDIEGWINAERDIVKLIRYVEETTPDMNKVYPRTFWMCMKVCVGSLSEEAQKLLLLIALCEGPSVPEDVLRIICETSKLLGEAAFNKLRSDLEEKALISIETQALPWAEACSEFTQKKWSLHRLQKQFLRCELSEDVTFLLELLFGETGSPHSNSYQDSNLRSVLCALYFDKSLCKKAGISSENFTARARLAIEPLTWLIQNHLDAVSYFTAKKALIDYVFREQIDDNDVARLLQSPHSAAAISWTLENMFWITDKSMICDGVEGMITSLVHLLGGGSDSNSREKALRVLTNVAGKATASQRISLAKFPNLLKGLISILIRYQGEAENTSLHKQQYLATRVLNFLASEEENKSIIVEFPSALDALVRCILKDDRVACRELQEYASVTLAILAGANSSQTKRRIIEFPGVLDGLVKHLNRDESSCAQQSAAAALAYLSISAGERNNRRILLYPNALSGLVNLLFKDEKPVYQMWAAWALTNLSVEEKNRKEIMNFPGVLARFVALLFRDDTPDVQKWCTNALAMLALDEECNRKIAEFPNALSGLVNLLNKEKNLQVRTWAALALSNLSCDVQTMKQISKFPNAVRQILEVAVGAFHSATVVIYPSLPHLKQVSYTCVIPKILKEICS